MKTKYLVLFVLVSFFSAQITVADDAEPAGDDVYEILSDGDILHTPKYLLFPETDENATNNETVVENESNGEDNQPPEKTCRTCVKDLQEKLAQSTGKKVGYVSPLDASPEGTTTSNMTSASLTYSKPLMPSGYPATNNPVLYANQNLTIDGVLRNLANTSVTVNFVVAIKNHSNDATIAQVASGATTLSAAGGATESKTLQNISGTILWNTGNNRGQFYVWMNVSPSGAATFTLDTKNTSFIVGDTFKADFVDCRTDNTEYYPGDVVQLSTDCRIQNVGNMVITGKLAIQIHKYDSNDHEWNPGIGWPIDLLQPAADITLNPGDNYSVVATLGAITWNITNDTEASTYRMMVAITDTGGVIKQQMVGSNSVDTMENSLPGITVDKYIDPTQFSSGGNQTTEVTLRVRPSGNSIRDAGVFATGSEAQDFKTPLDITFVVDTSGSMGDDWDSLVSVMQNIINRLSVDADIKHDIFAMGYYYGGKTSYVVNGVNYSIKLLQSGYVNGTPIFEDDYEGQDKWSMINNFSVTEDQHFSNTHSACSIYSPETAKIFEEDGESGTARWELVRWNLSTNQSNSTSHSFYSTLMDPLTHLEDDAEGGSAQWTLEQFALVDTDSYSTSRSFYCGYDAGEQTEFSDDAEGGSARWSLQKFEINNSDYHSASNSYLCNYTPDNQTFHDDAEGALKWNLSCFHLNNTVFNSSNTSFHSTYDAGVVLFFDDFENGTWLWNLSNWTRVNNSWYSENHSMLADNMSYTNLSSANMTLNQSIDLTGVANARLTFKANFSGMYRGYVYVSTNGGANWTKLTNIGGYNYLGGNTYDWVEYVYDLTPYVGNHILLRFEYERYYSYDYYDWFLIDDVKVDSFKMTNYMTLIEPLNYTNGTYPTVYFMMKSNITYNEGLYLEASQNGQSWTTVDYWYNLMDWTQKSVSLENYMNYPYLRFRVSFASQGQYVFIDDIYVNYSVPCIMTLTNPAPINYTNKGAVKLNLSMKENGSSYLRLQGSDDGVTWSNIASLYGSYYQWYNKSTTLSGYYEYNYLRLYYLPANENEHLYVDDIYLTYIPECVMTLVTQLNLSGTDGRVLDYYTKYNNTYSNYVYVEYSANGNTWYSLGTYYGVQSNWTNRSYAPGSTVKYIRFRFLPMYPGQYVYLDDIRVWSKQPNNMTLASYIDVVNQTKLRLGFVAKYNTTATVSVQYKFLDATSGLYSNWYEIGTFSGTSTTWDGKGYDLSGGLGFYSQLVFRFAYTPNSGQDYVYIDDIYVEGAKRNNMTLIAPIDLTSAEETIMINYQTLYNTNGIVYLDVSTDGGTTWTNMQQYSGSSLSRWEKKEYNPYYDISGASSMLLRFTHMPLWTSDYVCIDDVEVIQGAKVMSIGEEWWGDGTEYLIEEYGWREDAVKVVFPIGDECAHGNTCDAADTQAVLNAIEACQNRTVSVYPIHGTWGYSDPDVIADISALMNNLGSSCGGSVSDADNTSQLEDAVVASLSSELEIAGKNIAVSDSVVNDSEVAPDWTTFTADGNPITVPAGKKVTIDNKTLNVTFDKTYIGALASITSDPPEEVVITYTANLLNLAPGDKRDVNKGGTFIYQEPLKDQYRSGSFNGAYIQVNPGAELIILLDTQRLIDLGYNASHIQSLVTALNSYAANNNGTVYNLTKFRLDWQTAKGQNAFQGVYNPVNSGTLTNNGKWQWNGYPQDLRRLIHSLVIESRARYVVFVGSDNVIPFMRISDGPLNWESPDYDFVTLGGHAVVWSDFPYADINDDNLQDFVLARLLGTPAIMTTNIESASSKYVGNQNNSLIAYKWGLTSSGSTQPAHTNLVNTFKNTFGFNNLCVFNESCKWRHNLAGGKYYCVNGSQFGKPAGESDSVYYMRCNGESYVSRLDDGNVFIYSGSHGNDFRDAGNAVQEFSDDHYYWTGANWVGEPEFIKATDVVGKNIGHPFFVTKSCHGGSTYADDTLNTNMVLAFLSEGAVAYVGATGYSPTVTGAQFYSNLYAPLLVNQTIGQAYMNAKRSMVMANPGGTQELLAKISHLYGIPTYSLDIPKSRAGAPASKGLRDVGLEDAGYSVSTNVSGNQTSITVQVSNLTQTNVTTMENDSAIIFSIPDAQLYIRDGMPAVPVIVETINLPSSVDVGSLLATVSSSAQTIAALVPSITDVSEAQSVDNEIYSGAPTNISGTYPGNLTDYEVVNETSGNKTVVFRVFPVQYNESGGEVYFYENLTFGFVETEASAPLASLEVTTELTASDFTVNLRNTGSVDIENVDVTAYLPGNVSGEDVSEGGNYHSGNNTIAWSISSITTSGLDSIKVAYASLGVSEGGNYTINTTVTYFGQGTSNASMLTKSDSGQFSEITYTQSSLTALVTGWNLISLPLSGA
ncbi:MAG: hypothetical protein ABH834_02030 [Candidatus Altiarchaeota archaeon]